MKAVLLMGHDLTCMWAWATAAEEERACAMSRFEWHGMGWWC